jgi:hypothetical protein
MQNSNWDKFFFGFAIVTIISGIYLISQKEYVTGISGSITGAFLIYLQRMNKSKEENQG